MSSVLDALGRYEALAADAIVVKDQLGATTLGPGLPIRGDAELLPAGYRPDEHDRVAGACGFVAYHVPTRRSALDVSYNQGRSTVMSGAGYVAGARPGRGGGALSSVLPQVFLAVRFRRLINPALAVATVLAAAWPSRARCNSGRRRAT